MENLMRLLYVSKANSDISDDEIGDILTVSRRRNEEDKITGVLGYGQSYFTQIIEGPDEKLLRLYLRILGDSRHRDCLLLYIAPAKERLFEQWSMGFVDKVDPDALDFGEIAKLRTEPAGKQRALLVMDAMMIRLHKHK